MKMNKLFLALATTSAVSVLAFPQAGSAHITRNGFTLNGITLNGLSMNGTTVEGVRLQDKQQLQVKDGQLIVPQSVDSQQQLQQLLQQDVELQQQLKQAADLPQVAALVVAAAQEKGYNLDASEVESVLQEFMATPEDEIIELSEEELLEVASPPAHLNPHHLNLGVVTTGCTNLCTADGCFI